MFTDDHLIDQLKQSFHEATHSVATGPELPGIIRSQARQRRNARLAGTGGAVVLACALVVGVGAAASHQNPTASPGSTSSSSPIPDRAAPGPQGSGARFVNAAQVLDVAAQGTKSADAQTLPAGQYRFVRTHSYGITQLFGDHTVNMFSQQIDATWIGAPSQHSYDRSEGPIDVKFTNDADRKYIAQHAPGGIPQSQVSWAIDGQEVGVVGPAPVNDTPPNQRLSVWASPTGAAMAKLTREPIALRSLLYQYAATQHTQTAGAGKDGTVDDFAFSDVATVLASPNLPTDLRVALYQVAKTIPGIKLIGSLANYDGRIGVAVGRTGTDGLEQDLIFDTTSGVYIGSRTLATTANAQYRLPADTLIAASAVTDTHSDKPILPTGVTPTT